ncbi:MAG TPA: four-carbon acid sugar kinase family protein [Spirochaetales bacterium]|nr:four-carbon acid sugar kinase family protein [Spirochaetales bacterium]
MKYAVIADDLTGAGDTGAQFARAGLRTRSLFGDWAPEDIEGSDALVVNTDSRPLDPAAAYAAVRKAAGVLAAAGYLPVYKKIDSTLRGPAGRELDAVMDASGADLAVLCPAFPANKRIVRDGILRVDGVPVAETALSRDPVNPVKESRIAAYIVGQSRRPVRELGRSVLDGGEAAVRSALEDFRRAGGGIAVCDAGGEADLALLARAALSLGSGVILAGSAGLALPAAEILADRAGRGRPGGAAAGSAGSVSVRPDARTRPVVLAVGSVNPAARVQARTLIEAGAREFRLDPAEILEARSPAEAEAAAEALGLRAREALQTGGKVLIATPGDRSDVEAAQALGAGRGLSGAEVAAALARALAGAVRAAIRDVPDPGVAATGGDVARALLSALGSRAVDLLGEVSPGIPLCAVRGGERPGLFLVTKAGGFGAPDALEKAAALLSTCTRAEP